MKSTILSIGLLLTVTACSEKVESDATNEVVSVETPTPTPTLVGADVCGSRDTYMSIRDIVFDEAVKQISGDSVALNDRRRGVSVTMQFPLVKGINQELQRTDCSGRLVLGIPPGAAPAFSGERELKADLEYSVQPSADGNGSVITASGIGFLVQRLVTAEALRAMIKIANDGAPQLTKTFNPSFDCGRRLTNVERIICQDADLSRRDRQLSAAFKDRLAYYSGTEKSELLASQRRRLTIRAECPDTSCINAWYDEQLADYE